MLPLSRGSLIYCLGTRREVRGVAGLRGVKDLSRPTCAGMRYLIMHALSVPVGTTMACAHLPNMHVHHHIRARLLEGMHVLCDIMSLEGVVGRPP